MSALLAQIRGLDQASVEEKLTLIDELWESVRRTDIIPVAVDHLAELEKRVAAVNADPSIALTPAQARALFKK